MALENGQGVKMFVDGDDAKLADNGDAGHHQHNGSCLDHGKQTSWRRHGGRLGNHNQEGKGKQPEMCEITMDSSGGETTSGERSQEGGFSSSGVPFIRADRLFAVDNIDAEVENHFRQNSWRPSKFQTVPNWEIDPSDVAIKHGIAQGSHGSVFLGTYMGTDVAVKLLAWGNEDTMSAPEIDWARKSFQKEVELWHKLDHPNVAKFIGASTNCSNLDIPAKFLIDESFSREGVASKLCCIVVEFLAGGTLKEYLIRNRRWKLSFSVVIQLALDLSRGLEYLHRKKIAHRDLKSENVLLDSQGHLKIADFGLSRLEAEDPIDMTAATGTLDYMAPEVIDGQPYNCKCDVYSFGICLWEIYCCESPSLGLPFPQVAYAVVQRNLRPTIPKSCPASLRYVIERCLESDPRKRPDMSGVVGLIESIHSINTRVVSPTGSPPESCCLSCF